jgi:hypothetical protein
MCRTPVMIKTKNIYFLIAISCFVNLAKKLKYHFDYTVLKFQIAIIRIGLWKKVNGYGEKDIKKRSGLFAASFLFLSCCDEY